MIFLVSKAAETLRNLPEEYHYLLGRLVTPRHYGPKNLGLPWAADNDCFNGGLDEKAWFQMMRSMSVVSDKCLFASAPDVVADCKATLELFDHWHPQIAEFGFPVALVAQDGLTPKDVPWSRVDCIFIGGSTEWKLSRYAARVMREAKSHGKWVHVGRVNSVSRARDMEFKGADSVDGSGLARFESVLLRILEVMDYHSKHPTLFD